MRRSRGARPTTTARPAVHSRLKVQKLRDQSEESIRSGYARIWPGILMGHTHIVRSAYGVGTDCRGVGVTILVQIDVESIFRGVFL